MAGWNEDVIAMIWDFDKTLIPNYMQQVIFDEYGVDSKKFWAEVDQLPKVYEEKGCANITEEMLYLNHILDYARKGQFKHLCNDKLKELGKNIAFFPGLPDFLPHLKKTIKENDKYAGITLEHYVVSSGIRKIIEGSQIAEHLDGIWACEFLDKEVDGNKRLDRIAYVIGDTTKTRAIFEINKGTNINKQLMVNDSMPHSQRRVPITNMIYIADGPSDVPVFSVVKSQGGHTFGVYNSEHKDRDKKVYKLHVQERLSHYGKADYTSGTETAYWLEATVRRIADRIIQEQEESRMRDVGSAPRHT